MAWQWFPPHPAWQWGAGQWQVAADWSHWSHTQAAQWSAAQWSSARWDGDAAASAPSGKAWQSSAAAADATDDEAEPPQRVYNRAQKEWAHLSCMFFFFELTVHLWLLACTLHFYYCSLQVDFFICVGELTACPSQTSSKCHGQTPGLLSVVTPCRCYRKWQKIVA